MQISKIPVPDVYKRESADFRFFLKWIEESFSKIKYDHEHLIDLYDPLRCPKHLLWMLADQLGYKYDDRLPPAFCRLVLLYFMSMIRLKGSKNGVTLAAEVNLAQFNINNYGKEKDILYNRLEDTSIPVNAVSVVPHVEDGYIEVAYFSEQRPVDACLEYVRPVGMFIFPKAGVTVHARTRIWVDAMLTDRNDMNLSIGPTHIGHYSREDYARLQKMKNQHSITSDPNETAAVSNPEFDAFNGKFSQFIPVVVNDDAKIALVSKDDSGVEHQIPLPPGYVITYDEVKEQDKSVMILVTDSIHENGISRDVKTYYSIIVSSNEAITNPERYSSIRTVGLKNVVPYNTNESQAGTSYANAYRCIVRLIRPRNYHHSAVNDTHDRRPVWRRNRRYEVTPDGEINPGYRALYNLQMSNNEHVVKSLLPQMFSLGYGPQPDATESDEYYDQNKDIREDRPWDIKNLRYRDIHDGFEDGWSYLDPDRPQSTTQPKPRLNPVLAKIGDAIAMTPNPLEDYDNKEYTKSEDQEGKGKDIKIKPQEDV